MPETTGTVGRIAWDKTGERYFEAGVDRGVLYTDKSTTANEDGKYTNGVAWNGLTSITESPSGAEATPLYANNRKYLNLMSNEEFGGTIEAYMYPDEFAECDGSKEILPGLFIGQQARKTFGLSYRSLIGNDVSDTNAGYKIHLVYHALAAVSEKARETINENLEPEPFSWEFTTTSVDMAANDSKLESLKLKPTAHLVVDSRTVGAEKLKALEDILYGTENTAPYLPSPDVVYTMIKGEAA
jgi:hypothetical protein